MKEAWEIWYVLFLFPGQMWFSLLQSQMQGKQNLRVGGPHFCVFHFQLFMLKLAQTHLHNKLTNISYIAAFVYKGLTRIFKPRNFVVKSENNIQNFHQTYPWYHVFWRINLTYRDWSDPFSFRRRHWHILFLLGPRIFHKRTLQIKRYK